jgi:uncharacterized radical SAM superfamily protein
MRPAMNTGREDYKSHLGHSSSMSVPNFYFPGKRFPAVSVTGERCALSCQHCNAHYLRGMNACTEPDDLVEFAQELEHKGGAGFLLSGGCDIDGRIPLESFYPAIREIKDSTGLSINLHVGLIDSAEAVKAVESGADVISADVVGDNDTIREILNLNATTGEYERMLIGLVDLDANVVPHVTAGLHFGKLRGEERALEMMGRIEPETIVVNSILPTKGTSMEGVRLDSGGYLSVLGSARRSFPRARIIMGCMRPRDSGVDKKALDMGIDGIVMPSRRIVEEYRHVKVEACCAIPH